MFYFPLHFLERFGNLQPY